MGKDTRLVNIYLKIHNKQPLMMDDLRYLAKYAPECFEKTCKNVVYNIPEAKPLMEPISSEIPVPIKEKGKSECIQTKMPDIEQILENIKRLERDDFPVVNIEADKVKDLLGNLYMELLFPHNDKDTFFDVESRGTVSMFDKKI